jgi:SAM-dependent methyltransferase
VPGDGHKASLATFLAALDIAPYDYMGNGGPGLPPLDKSMRGRLNRRINAIGCGPTVKGQKSLYGFVASNNLIGYLHSIKADAIRASGEAVAAHLEALPAGARVLDVGCNVGHLTTWYAHRFPHLEFVGCDFVPEAIDYAARLAERLGLTNVRFAVADLTDALPDGPFDAIVSTQAITAVEGDRPAVLGRVAAALRDGGILIGVDVLPDAPTSEAFIQESSSVGLGTVHQSFAHYHDDAAFGAYPVMVFRKGATPEAFDIEAAHLEALTNIHHRELRAMGWSEDDIVRGWQAGGPNYVRRLR